VDGYVKVCWRSAKIVELWPQVAALLGFVTALPLVARLLERRCERG